MNKSNRCKHQDRLSELPDALIFEIFWLLPMTDVVRTTTLSKRWNKLWTTTPFLNFDNNGMLFPRGDKLQNFINRALLRWNGNGVLKFKFDSLYQLDASIYSDIDFWVSFAKRNGVEELCLRVYCRSSTVFFGKEEVYRVPQCLYTCSSLKELTLADCNLEIFGNVQWNQLKSLSIDGFRVSACGINQILSGSPQLGVFTLSIVDKGESLSIQSSSLKKLSIRKDIFNYEYLSMDSELRIWTPNLETLEIAGIPYSKCLLMNVSSLNDATLGLSGLQHVLFEEIEFEHGLFSGDDFQGNTLSQVLPSIQHVENVALTECCSKVLGVLKMKCMHSSFPNVKSLELTCCFSDYEQVVGLLEIFPQLERLVLEDYDGDDYQGDRESLKFEAKLPKTFLLQLRTFEVTWINGDIMFPLIEILLKYASKLESMVFRVKKSKWSHAPPLSMSLFVVSQKLLRMRRSSPNCTIDFYDDRNETESWYDRLL